MENTLGKRISQNRKSLNLTQDQLAEKLGVTAQAVSKWENDQSCPDITMLPRLAEIFGVTTDELLGHNAAQTVRTAKVVDKEEEVIHVQKGNWQFQWDSGRRSALGFAILVIAVGALYLASQLLSWELSLWDILWPTAILVFGLCGITGSFSFFRIGCVLFGGYTLTDKLFQFPFDLEGNLIWAVLIILFGFSLLADAAKKARKPKFSIHIPSGKETGHDYTCEGDSFTYSSRFGEYTQIVVMDTLRHGDVSVSFGEYTIDLTNVTRLADDCGIHATSSFGELRFVVPRKYRVITEYSTGFAAVDITGEPDDEPEGQITLTGRTSFGELCIEYV